MSDTHARPLAPAHPHRGNRPRAALALIALALGAGAGTSVHAAPAKRPGDSPKAKPAPRGAGKIVLTGPVTWTAVSGQTAGLEVTLGKEGRRRGVRSISWWEDRDNPCMFQVWTRNFNSTETFNATPTEFEWCGGSPGDKKTVSMGPRTEYVTALSVCLTDKRDTSKNKIKGLRLWGRMVKPSDGSLGPENGPQEAQRPNCKEGWQQRVTCPAGTVADRVKIYRRYPNGNTSQTYATGISLGCRSVIKR